MNLKIIRQYLKKFQKLILYYADNKTWIDEKLHIKTEFDNIAQIINSYYTLQVTALRHKTSHGKYKSTLRNDMAEKCLLIMNSLLVFTRFNAGVEPIEGLSLSASALHKMRELELLGLARRVQHVAAEHLAGLAPYGTQPANLVAFVQATDAFEDEMDKPQKAIEKRSKARQQLTQLVVDGREICRTLEIYMRPVQYVNPGAYQLYTAVNRLGKVPTSRMDLRVWVKNQQGQPLEGAVVTLSHAEKKLPTRARKRKTRKGGLLKYQNLPPGSYTITATAAQGTPTVQQAELLSNERAEVVFTLG